MKSYGNLLIVSLLLAVFLSSCSLLPSNRSLQTAKGGDHDDLSGASQHDIKHAQSANDSASESPDKSGPPAPVQSAELGAFTLEIYGPDEGQAPYLIFKDGERIMQKVEAGKQDRLELLNAEEDGAATPLCKLTDGKDPNVVIMHYLADGNSKCYVFSIGKTIRKIATISTGTVSPIFEKVEKSDRFRLVAEDLYKDWGIQAIAPQVVLKWKHGKFVLDDREMKKRRLHANANSHLNQAIIDEFKSLKPEPGEVISQAPPELADQVICMYYCGEGTKAKQYFDSYWPKRVDGKEAYWSFLMDEMQKSPYWPAIKALNRGT